MMKPWFKRAVTLSLLCACGYTQAADKKILLTTTDWQPYIAEKADAQGRHGYVYDVAVEAFKRAGYTVEISFFPWERAVNMARAGQADAVYPEYFVEKDWAILSTPFPGGPIGLYKRKDNPIKFTTDPQKDQLAALQDLKKYNFGVVYGYVNTTIFDGATFLKKETAINDEKNLQKLHGKRVDFAVIDKFVARTLLQQPDLKSMESELEFLEPALENKDLYVDFSKAAPNYKEKAEAFNKALTEMKADGTLKKIMESYGF
jgi:ABC-type amino acid transport substrate-binding protein